MANKNEELNSLYYKRGYRDGYVAATKIAMGALNDMIENLTKDLKEENETNL